MSLLAGLRRERGPLATLAAVAMLARVVLGALGIAAMPSAAISAVPVICTSSASAPVSHPSGIPGPAHLADCPCGHVCPHGGTPVADAGRLAPALTHPAPRALGALVPPDDARPDTARRARGLSIRAPPAA
ncbi:hypothetical protein D1F64_05370 [Breoghania sp. L-A4]|nr:hypothetical protein D1F64_05370 [Breoghania sp. L-A4]